MLGHYVREASVLTLNEAIAKMSLKPAQRLEAFVPAMKHKGRLQVGAKVVLDWWCAIVDRYIAIYYESTCSVYWPALAEGSPWTL